MVLTVYGHPISQPARSVYLLCKIAKIPYVEKTVDLFTSECNHGNMRNSKFALGLVFVILRLHSKLSEGLFKKALRLIPRLPSAD